MQPYPKANSELEEKISLTISRMAYVRTKSEKIERKKKLAMGRRGQEGRRGTLKTRNKRDKMIPNKQVPRNPPVIPQFSVHISPDVCTCSQLPEESWSEKTKYRKSPVEVLFYRTKPCSGLPTPQNPFTTPQNQPPPPPMTLLRCLCRDGKRYENKKLVCLKYILL